MAARRKLHRTSDVTPCPPSGVVKRPRLLDPALSNYTPPCNDRASGSGVKDSSKAADAFKIFDRVVFTLEQQLAQGPTDIMGALGLPRGSTTRSVDGAPPSAVLRAIQDQVRSGKLRDPGALADAVAAQRHMCKVVTSSVRTYLSHLRMIR